ncbi:hypothetical protein SNEBB_005806, partial [Seison nebaliae]
MFSIELALFEANALVGKQHHPIARIPEYKMIKLATSDIQLRGSSITPINDYIDLEAVKKSVCLFSQYLKGTSIHPLVDLPIISKNIKSFLIFFIMALKQLQAIHFTINHYPYSTENVILRNVVNAHADIHVDNVLKHWIHLKDGERYLVPVLIDYGLESFFFYANNSDFISEIYNNHLRSENQIKEEYIISHNRIYNFWQNIDFCQILVLTADTFTIIVRTLIYDVCKRFRHQMENPMFGENIYQYIPLFNHIPPNLQPILPVIEVILRGVLRGSTYRHWREIVDLLYVDDQSLSDEDIEYPTEITEKSYKVHIEDFEETESKEFVEYLALSPA